MKHIGTAIVFLLLFGLLLCPVVSWAQSDSAMEESADSASDPAETAEEEDEILYDPNGETVTAPDEPLPELGSALFKLAVVMIVLLALLALGLSAFQKITRGRSATPGGERPLRIVDKLSLGPKKWICLLNACGRHVVVGVAEKEINVLMEVSLDGDEGETGTDFATAMAGMQAADAAAEK